MAALVRAGHLIITSVAIIVTRRTACTMTEVPVPMYELQAYSHTVIVWEVRSYPQR